MTRATQSKRTRRERADELLAAAAKYLRDDLFMRAEKDDDGTVIVACGHGCWVQFNRAIEAYERR